MKPILLYASEDEVKYIDYEPKICIGVKAVDLGLLLEVTFKYDSVILFGCSGLTGSHIKRWKIKHLHTPLTWMYHGDEISVNYCFPELTNTLHFYDPAYGYTVSQRQSKGVQSLPFIVVDQESYHVARLCQRLEKKFVSVRYIIDMCDKKVYPPVINYFWRKFQHKRMQSRMNKILEAL